MPISWNEIKDRALKFSQEWATECAEDAEGKSFLDDFFRIFGVPRRRVASFEQRVNKADGRSGYIDLIWKGVLLIEQKSRGKDLSRAYAQAIDYFSGLKDCDLPRYLLVCNFSHFRLYDLEAATRHEFALAELHQNVHLFGFIAGYKTTAYQEQDPVNIRAAEAMGKLHNTMQTIGYAGAEVEIYLMRLVFCLFADATSIFEVNQFRDLIANRTAEDGHDLAQWLDHLFQVLNTPETQRLTTLDEQLAAFPYINGRLFEKRLNTAAFNEAMREQLLACCRLNWRDISPAIFGALFQSVKSKEQRRAAGEHYTSEQNILKLIRPLFLDALHTELTQIGKQKIKLFAFQQKLAALTFLDPACGCGNFLVVAYRELRLLELEVLKRLFGRTHDLAIGVGEFNVWCNVQQFYGIEVEEFPAQIAQTALWLTDHQMNMEVSKALGVYYKRIPLKQTPVIHHGNALQVDWRELIEPSKLNFIFGNPPFVGKNYQTTQQKQDVVSVFCDVKSVGNLDYVTAWFRKATDYMVENRQIKTAFVSTSSITQGEQVGVLWGDLLRRGIKIHFAHRTFQWTNEATGLAAVHCVIVGFALHDVEKKPLFNDDNGKAKLVAEVSNINPYLIAAPDVVLTTRSKPLFAAPSIMFGSMPNDGGFLLLSTQDKEELLRREPRAENWIRKFLGSEEFINNQERYCLWLVEISPSELRTMPAVLERVNKVRAVRLSSKRPTTQALAKYPTLFSEIRQPQQSYLLIPRVSSETRNYIPIGYVNSKVICGDANLMIVDATLYHFGVLSSVMHMAWTRAVAGRLESRYRYSAGIVYNNFPWPANIAESQRNAIEAAAQKVLDARAKFPDQSFADLYDALAMPPLLKKAHQALDRVVDAAYSAQKLNHEQERVALLFGLYQQLTTPLVIETAPTIKRSRSRKNSTTK
ncbi:DNA methyltransferase [Chromatium okenii]|uniref:site-specific DNA-methyltransferase (adenine-specific) n=1 Tax=Chromatium okenii TaxID=61644 RepID=A0A2S7XSE4_9GAMM|nr:DNA methyltransferase [Chromatium okenii]MBV5308347.1 class I SAM-dependent DNA methyltransferase [Chromatium okenii]PQJ96473.1 SAM-dependent methyltransferase [Chromatium okenii]